MAIREKNLVLFAQETKKPIKTSSIVRNEVLRLTGEHTTPFRTTIPATNLTSSFTHDAMQGSNDVPNDHVGFYIRRDAGL